MTNRGGRQAQTCWNNSFVGSLFRCPNLLSNLLSNLLTNLLSNLLTNLLSNLLTNLLSNLLTNLLVCGFALLEVE
jgi:hypothetical protein